MPLAVPFGVLPLNRECSESEAQMSNLMKCTTTGKTAGNQSFGAAHTGREGGLTKRPSSTSVGRTTNQQMHQGGESSRLRLNMIPPHRTGAPVLPLHAHDEAE